MGTLYDQGYRLVGNHSAIKVCMWTKRAIKNQDFCYKQKFYGIQSHRCVQMTPALPFCTLRCEWCWRDIDFTKPKWHGKVDDPKEIIDVCIKEHIKYLQGFGGNEKTDWKKFEEAKKPLHFAISLSGEPTFYPKLPQMIDELHKRKITSFLVTNGTNPNMLKKLLRHQPTQLYITLAAPNKEIFERSCKPLIKNAWNNLMKSLALMPKFKCRKTIRLTLTKNVNMFFPEKYSELIKKAKPDFVEVKAYMWVGYSTYRLKMNNMPSHQEIKEFAKKIGKIIKYKIVDEKENSRVVLLMKKDKGRKIKLDMLL